MSIPGVIVAELSRHEDERGYFSEVARLGDLPTEMLQASHSHSKEGVLRGLHFHRAQADLWYLARGSAQIALVDLRARGSAPQVDTLVADATNPTTVFIPPGVAHGYLALTDIDMLYLTSKTWDPDDEQGLAWDDPTFAIEWRSQEPRLSDRDRSNPAFAWHDIPRF